MERIKENKVCERLSDFKNKNAIIFLKNKFRYTGTIREITLDFFLIFYDNKEKQTIMIPLNEISLIQLTGGEW